MADPLYKKIATEEFNCLTPENKMKWTTIENTRGHYNYGPADQLVEFAQKNGMKIFGTTLMWHIEVPKWVTQLNKTELEQVMKAHVKYGLVLYF